MIRDVQAGGIRASLPIRSLPRGKMISQTSTTDFTWGVNVHNRAWNLLSTAQELDLAKTIGLTSLRIDIYDASPDWINWLSSLVSEASSKGISIMPVIVPNQSVCRDEATAYAWGQQVGSALATAFPHLTWQAGNELDEFAIKSGTTGQSASDYDQGRYSIAMGAIKGLEDGIHQADPTAHVAVGITGIHYAFLQRLARDGVSWDITGETYYIGHGDTQIPQELDGVLSQLAQFNRPILVTEFNQFEGSLLSPTEEANTLVAMMSTMKNLAAKYNIIGAYIYELVDEPPLTGGDAHYGLASQTGSLNPAGLAVQQYLASLYGPVVTTIEALGATDLKQVADTYFTYAHGTTSGPQLKMSGAAVTVGQFGAWTPIAAEQTASGYEVAWKNGGADQYIAWNLDGSGNYLSAGPVLSAASTALQVLEPGFSQDLNGDRRDHAQDGHRVGRIDDAGQDCQHLRRVSNHQRAGSAAQTVRRGDHGGSVRCLDADRCRGGWKRLLDRLEERRARSVHRLERRQQRQLPHGGYRRGRRHVVHRIPRIRPCTRISTATPRSAPPPS